MSGGAVACTACLAAVRVRPRETFREPIFGRDFQIYKCPECGVEFSVMPADFPLQDWYGRAEHLYSEVEWMAAGASPVWRFEYFFKLARRLDIKGALLDVGCGEGRFLSYARREGWNGALTGLDFNSGMIRRSEGGLRIEVGPLERFVEKTGPQKFDAVVMFDVLEHMAEPAKAVEWAKILLKDKAYLCVTVPNAERVRFFDRETCDYPPNHFTRWNAGALRLVVERAGFEVLALKTPWYRPSDFSDQFFYPLLARAMPWLKRFLFGSAAASGATLTELLAAAPAGSSDAIGLKSRLGGKAARKKTELALRTLFSVLCAPLTLPLCLALRFRRFGGTGLFLLARLK